MTPARVLVGLLCLAHYANGFSGITSLARSVAQGPASVWHRSLVSATSLTYPEAKGCGKRCGRNIVQATDGVEGEANGLRETEGTEGESGEAGEAGGDVSLSAEVGAGGAMVLVENPDRGNVLTRAMKAVSRFFSGGKDKPDLKALGLYALLSYGFVSNVSYAVLTGIAWFASSKKSGLSPLAPDQWGLFMVCWTGLWAVNNILRVPRLALSVTLAPYFDRFISFIMAKTGRGKGVATGICVFTVNVVGTCTLMAGGILLASALSGLGLAIAVRHKG